MRSNYSFGGLRRKAKSRKKKSKNKTNIIVYSYKDGGYVSESASELIDVAMVGKSGIMDYYSENYEKIFPQYDDEKHQVSYFAEPSASLKNKFILCLYEYTDLKVNEIPFGCYRATMSVNYTPILKPLDIDSDQYVDIGQELGMKLYDDFKIWRSERQFYEKKNRVHKKSTLLYGPPGCGKTMEVIRLLNNAKKDKFIGILIDSKFELEYMEDFRQGFDGQDTCIAIEEITQRTDDDNPEVLLTLLDGEKSWNNSYIIATTNYPDELPQNIIDRTRRFKDIIEVGPPTDVQRRKYFEAIKLDMDVDELVRITKNFSMDYITDLVFDYQRTGVSFDKLIEKLEKQRKRVSKTFKQSLGLGSDY